MAVGAEVSESVLRWITALNWSAAVGADLLTGGVGRQRDQAGMTMIGYWERSLKNLSTEQRTVFTVFAIMVMVMAIFGNVVTIITNVRREQRHLLRVCMLSLALSDIAFVTVTSVVYLSQFNTEFNSLWTLGELMCTFSPFVQTMAVLVNSITLVAIALDRYMAVRSLVKGVWEPNGWFCATCAVLIWGLAAGIASPMLTLYEVYDIVVLTTDSQHPVEIISGYYMATICATDKSKNSYYFVIVFVVIFLPLLAAFCWLNGVIARAFWVRRHPVGSVPKGQGSSGETCNDKKTLTTHVTTVTHPVAGKRTPASVFSKVESCVHYLITNLPVLVLVPSRAASNCTCPHHQTTAIIGEQTTQTDVAGGSPSVRQPQQQQQQPPGAQGQPSEAISNRRRRQVHMFKAIVVLMLVFFVCRLPMWVFLLVKMVGEANTSTYWNLHYSFGILAMVNAVLNPLMYTFLTETIRFTLFVKAYCVRACVQPCRNGARWVGAGGGDCRFQRHRDTKDRDSGGGGKEAHHAGIYMGD
uniref:G-protein coupled receptors family 1 profile domain-containing protein n=1 Tax=Anopheles dirus TaxID=7168 RepID=A0A182N2R7_9DIPT